MEIPNLANQLPDKQSETVMFSIPVLLIVLTISLVSGFWLSRFFPQGKGSSNPSDSSITGNSTDNISGSTDLVTGKLYGNVGKNFKDTAVGVVEKGNINGVGTHILTREGGADQRASLISSTVDLDLFIGKKVEIKGETNVSSKTGWLLDAGSIKIIQ